VKEPKDQVVGRNLKDLSTDAVMGKGKGLLGKRRVASGTRGEKGKPGEGKRPPPRGRTEQERGSTDRKSVVVSRPHEPLEKSKRGGGGGKRWKDFRRRPCRGQE